ncbi:hypothetical protein COU37_03965 [Candidatus Micrarchaeota archaeon CG10_big_fil_rev_8_21_14_0_10_45_29]|nr:MAG: hypothetical protein COU37_03965 [Candidatus Micrarchaeota archaeon CG10_big_fil_rev_8_21_14_0_10_45_29]
MKLAQTTVELLVIFGAAVIVLSVLAAVLPSNAVAGQSARDKNIAQATVRDLSQAVNEVYLGGDGASKDVWIEVPMSANISASFIGNNTEQPDWGKRKTIAINLLTEGDVFSVSRAPVCGQWPSMPGKYRIKIEYNATEPVHIMINSSC